MATARCTWTAASGADGYNVYLKSNGEFEKQNTELILGTTYDIEDLEDGSYEAYATTVIGALESDPSNVKSFEVGAEPEPTVEVFTESGTWDWGEAGQPSKVDVLVVGGGGAGGWTGGNNAAGGGGGAGGLVWETGVSVSGDVVVTVGDGGDPVEDGAGEDGEPSSFGDIEAEGGGGGARFDADGRDGGSGGGAAGRRSLTGGGGGSGTEGQGNDGGARVYTGTTNSNDSGGAGGGGAGGAGEDIDEYEDRNVRHGFDGGLGLDFSEIFGTEVGDDGWFASGGVGGPTTYVDPIVWRSPIKGGGAGEGQQHGMANTGGGGRGGLGTLSTPTGQGSGGSGIVIVRY